MALLEDLSERWAVKSSQGFSSWISMEGKKTIRVTRGFFTAVLTDCSDSNSSLLPTLVLWLAGILSPLRSNIP